MMASAVGRWLGEARPIKSIGDKPPDEDYGRRLVRGEQVFNKDRKSVASGAIQDLFLGSFMPFELSGHSALMDDDDSITHA